MADFKLKGLGVALVTPFKKDKTVDFDALKRMVEYIIEGKSDYIVVLGTTGETPALFPDEKEEIMNFVKEVNAGRIPLVCQGFLQFSLLCHTITSLPKKDYTSIIRLSRRHLRSP